MRAIWCTWSSPTSPARPARPACRCSPRRRAATSRPASGASPVRRSSRTATTPGVESPPARRGGAGRRSRVGRVAPAGRRLRGPGGRAAGLRRGAAQRSAMTVSAPEVRTRLPMARGSRLQEMPVGRRYLTEAGAADHVGRRSRSEPRPSEITRPSAVTVTFIARADRCECLPGSLTGGRVDRGHHGPAVLQLPGTGQSTTIRYLPAALSRVRHAQVRGTGHRQLGCRQSAARWQSERRVRRSRRQARPRRPDRPRRPVAGRCRLDGLRPQLLAGLQIQADHLRRARRRSCGRGT